MIFPKRLSKIALFMTTSNNNYIFKPVEIDGEKVYDLTKAFVPQKDKDGNVLKDENNNILYTDVQATAVKSDFNWGVTSSAELLSLLASITPRIALRIGASGLVPVLMASSYSA